MASKVFNWIFAITCPNAFNCPYVFTRPYSLIPFYYIIFPEAGGYLKMQYADLLQKGDTIGIISPSHIAIVNFALLAGGDFLPCDPQQDYLLILEDHEKFDSVAAVSVFLSHVEQSRFIGNVRGLVFGHYSEEAPDDLLRRLERFGRKHKIPVVYCDDFGHYTEVSLLPIGAEAALDTDIQELSY